MSSQRHTIERGDGHAEEHMFERGEVRTDQHRIERGARPAPAQTREPAVGDLIRQLGTDGAALVRNEVALAKLEIRDMARDIALDAARLFGAIAFAIAGAFTLLAAITIALGNALDGRYALAALIVGVVVLVIGGVLARAGIAGLKRSHAPEQTAESLRTTGHWAKRELRGFKEEIRS